MLFLKRLRIFAILSAVTISGCSLDSQQPLGMKNNLRLPGAASTAAVSVFADTEEGLMRQAAAARSAGLTPSLVTIKGPRGAHLFPVYAVVARKGQQLLVLAYKKLYVYDARKAQIYYPDAIHSINIASLPTMTGGSGQIVGSCLGCVNVLSNAATLRRIAEQMASLSDPWQRDVAYKPWSAMPKDSQNTKVTPALTTIVTVTASGGGGTAGGSGGGGGGCTGNKLLKRAPRGFTPNSACTGGGGGAGGAELVAYSGRPQPGQTCDSSKPIGDLVGRVNQNNTATPEYIAMINAVVGWGTPTMVNPGTVAIDTPIWGWIYKDGDGHFWVQANANAGQPWTAGIQAWFLSVGISSPTQTTPHYYGTTPPPQNKDEVNGTCWPDSTTAWA